MLNLRKRLQKHHIISFSQHPNGVGREVLTLAFVSGGDEEERRKTRAWIVASAPPDPVQSVDLQHWHHLGAC